MSEKIEFSSVSFLLAMIIFVLFIWGFMEIADKIAEKETLKFDERILQTFKKNYQSICSPDSNGIGNAVRDITALGGYALLIIAVVISGGYFILTRNYAPALHLFSVLSVGALICNFLKVLFSKPRPDIEHAVYVASYSFPSGHSMMSAAVYLTLGVTLASMEPLRPIKIYLLVISALLTMLVGLSRVYLGVHYPTDVLAGWLAGTVWALICLLIAQTHRKDL
jgi:undecaprenyl-diphosphatase